MREEERFINLEMINNEYKFIIYDNCPLSHSLQGKNEKPSINDEEDFSDFLMEKISEGYNCFLPSSVVDEYLDPRRMMSSREEINSKRKRLIKTFEKHKRIIRLNSQEENLYWEYIKLFPEYQEEYGVDFTDFGVFSYATVFSEMRGPTSIISNDIKGISKIWNDVINQSIFNRSEFGFFVRREIDLYERF